jgi:hypothetical protein
MRRPVASLLLTFTMLQGCRDVPTPVELTNNGPEARHLVFVDFDAGDGLPIFSSDVQGNWTVADVKIDMVAYAVSAEGWTYPEKVDAYVNETTRPSTAVLRTRPD